MRAVAQKKIKHALAGSPIEPFSVLQIAKMRPNEFAQLREEVGNRLGRLTPQEHACLTENSWLAVLSFSTEQLRAIAGAPV